MWHPNTKNVSHICMHHFTSKGYATMPPIRFLLTVFSSLVFYNPSYSQEITNQFICTNIKGKSLLDTGYNFSVSDDGFINQSIEITFFEKGRAKGALVKWDGLNQREITAIRVGENYKDGGIIFFSEIQTEGNTDVGRSYALFLGKLTLTFVEQQTKIFSQTPQVRVMRANCVSR